MKKEKLLIIGCGDIGRRLAGLISTQPCYEISGLCRSGRRQPACIQPLRANARSRADMRALFTTGFDVVVVTLTPDGRSDADYHNTYVESMQVLVGELLAIQATAAAMKKRDAMDSLPCPRLPRLVLFVSSTSVYGQDSGEEVDEQAPTNPSGFAGRRLLEAERLLLDSHLHGCVVRFSGIYGREGRGGAPPHLLQQVIEGIGCAPEPPQYTNRIHADDCAGVLAHLLERQRQGLPLSPVYLGTDCEPVSLWDIKHWLARQLGLPAAHLAQIDNGRRAGSKRCLNRLLLETGYRFQYPSYREGHKALLENLALATVSGQTGKGRSSENGRDNQS